MVNDNSITPGWNPYGTQIQPWSPWVPKDQRSPLDTAKTSSLDKTSGPDTASSFSVDKFGFLDGSLVYTGSDNPTMPALYFNDGVGGYLADPGNSEQPITMSSMAQSIMGSRLKTPGKVFELKQKLFDLGYLSGKSGQLSLSRGDDLDSLFDVALQQFLNEGSIKNLTAAKQGKKTLSFDEWLKVAGPFSGGQGGSGSGGGVDTRLLYQKFEPEDFEIPVDQLFQATLGRGASQDELNDFVAKLNTYAEANPQKTVTKVSGGTTSTTVTGGVSNQQIETRLREQALNTQGAEEYNKATKYLNYFTEALSSPVRLG